MSVHFLWSLFYLGLTILLVFCYFLVPFCIYILIRWLRQAWVLRKESTFPKLIIRSDFKKIALLFVFSLLINTAMYIPQRIDWTGREHPYPEAKEYWVAGQVVFGYRIVFADFFHPENALLKPLNVLQKDIYNRGIQYLPKNDGERYVWTYAWLVYPHSRKMWIIKGTDAYWKKHKKANPAMVAFLDREWRCLEGMAVNRFADKKMYQHHYLRNYPGMAHHWAYQNGYYTGRQFGSARLKAKMPELTGRLEKLVGWLEALEQKWDENKTYMVPFLQAHPKVEAMRQVSLSFLLVNIFDARIWSDTFSCDDPFILKLVENRRIFIEGKNGEQAARERMYSKQLASKFYDVVVNSEIGRFTKLILDEYCQYSLAGEADLKRWHGGFKSVEIKDTKSLFRREIKKLEEQKND